MVDNTERPEADSMAINEETIRQGNQEDINKEDIEYREFLDVAAGVLLSEQEKKDADSLYLKLLLVNEEIIRLTSQRTEAKLTSSIQILLQRRNYILKLMDQFTSPPPEEDQKPQENTTRS